MTASIVRVHVNGIEVGSIPTDTYDEVLRSVKKDPRLYLAYAFSYIRTTWRLLRHFAMGIPWLIIAGAVLMAVGDPDSFTQIVTHLRAVAPAEITAAVRRTIFISSQAVAVSSAVMWICYPRIFSIDSPFEEAVCKRIRHMLKVPADGDVTISVDETATELRT